MRACIIGAGGAGLCAARHLSALVNWEPLIYEQSNKLGGVWVYQGENTDNENNRCWNSVMYKNLRTNLPKQVMAFPDFPFPSSLPSFIGRSDVNEYLKAYADHFNLRKYIKFNHEVTNIEKRLNSGDGKRWSVATKNLTTNEIVEDTFDSIFICNGHYSKPHIPQFPNADQFRGIQIHSSMYRVPERFSDMRVACFGVGPSGIDIAIDLHTCAEKVYLCHNGPPLQCPLPSNFIQLVLSDCKFYENGLIVGSDSNARKVPLDAVLYCTGYEYDFPFIKSPSFGLSTDGRRVSPLYQHMIDIEEPTVFIIGLCFIVFPFPFFDIQMQYAISILSSKSVLPSAEEMLAWEANDYKYRREVLKFRHKESHFQGPLQWDYIVNLSKLGGFKLNVAPVIKKLYDHIREYRKSNLLGYHSVNYQVIDDENFIVLSDK